MAMEPLAVDAALAAAACDAEERRSLGLATMRAMMIILQLNLAHCCTLASDAGSRRQAGLQAAGAADAGPAAPAGQDAEAGGAVRWRCADLGACLKCADWRYTHG